MPTASLPENPSLEHLKSQAKLIRDLIRSGDDGALGMIDEYHPRLDAASLSAAEREGFKTTDAQLIVARLYGLASWNQLRDHLNVVAERSFTPRAERVGQAEDAAGNSNSLSPVDTFIVAACLDYSEEGPRPEVRIAEAHRLLAATPSLATESPVTRAIVGDHLGLAETLDDGPAGTDVVNAVAGPNGWPLLLYATYSRIETDDPARSALETVKVLLARGADPNAGFLWRGLVPPFTALTGAFGGGESRQPWSSDRLGMARLLLEAGADPNDGQALYNNGIGGQNHDNPSHLQLLREYGLGTEVNGPWYRSLGRQLRDPAELLYDELEAAAKRNRPEIMRFLLDEVGLDPTRAIGRSQQPPARVAATEGHGEILALLAERGVSIELDPVERALGHIRGNNVEGLVALVAAEPETLAELRRQQPGCCNLVGADHANMLAHLIGLGFDINDRSTTKTPLHHAAEAGDTERARLLLDHGADANLADTHIGATPWGWANYNGHPETAAMLEPVTVATHEPQPDITVRSPGDERTWATPDLVEAWLDQLDGQARPVLVTLRIGRTALTIGVGHPNLSVALYLNEDGVAHHAAVTGSASADPESAFDGNAGVENTLWTGFRTEHQFFAHAYRSKATVRSMATEFMASTGQPPSEAEWVREGDT